MRRVLLHRLAMSVVLLVSVSAFSFVLAGLTPGNPAQTILGTQANASAVTALEQELGFDRPVYEQYGEWLSNVVLHGDLGKSVFTDEPVSRILGDALPITLTLIVASILLALLIGIPLGVASARRSGGGGQAIDVVSLVGFAMPAFWLALLLVLLFSTTLEWLPPSGWIKPEDSISGWLQSIILPVSTLALGLASLIAKQTRVGMLKALNRDYVRALRARGIPERSVVYKHALRNALPDVVTLVGTLVVTLLLSATLVESVFALQGLGSIAIRATSQHDLPVLEGVALYFTLIVVVTFAITDVVRAWLNPKLRRAG